MAKKVTVIPAKVNLQIEGNVALSPVKRKVAGYARVSTDKDEQGNSMDAQLAYYPKFIKEHENWEFVGMYSDEGITGCNTKKRDGFNKMVADALAGKIDLIITKSVSRFARNTVDSLSTIRKLKEKGIECYFEKENIWTFDGKGELMITIMSSLAQEESRSISENTTWGQRKRFADGKVNMPFSAFLGYDRGKDGVPIVNEKQAEIVRLIYRLFINGKTPSMIANYLMEQKIKTVSGKAKWTHNRVISILTNEKYAGNALLQKSYCSDFLTKKIKKNNGEIPQWFVENSHPAIISPDEWDLVQAELKRRKELGLAYNNASGFSRKIVCECCGGHYGRKTWGSYKNNVKYKKQIWQCNEKFSKKCTTPNWEEENLKKSFVEQFNRLLLDRENLIADCELIKTELCNISQLDEKIATLESEIEVTYQLAKAEILQSGEKKHLKRLDKMQGELKKLQSQRQEKFDKQVILNDFIKTVENTEVICEFDELLFIRTVDRVVAKIDGRLEFEWKQ